jgi:hypothetical protein
MLLHSHCDAFSEASGARSLGMIWAGIIGLRPGGAAPLVKFRFN